MQQLVCHYTLHRPQNGRNPLPLPPVRPLQGLHSPVTGRRRRFQDVGKAPGQAEPKLFGHQECEVDEP